MYELELTLQINVYKERLFRHQKCKLFCRISIFHFNILQIFVYFWKLILFSSIHILCINEYQVHWCCVSVLKWLIIKLSRYCKTLQKIINYNAVTVLYCKDECDQQQKIPWISILQSAQYEKCIICSSIPSGYSLMQ